MEQELISKREILERYKISYGALYRWKRMGLIPEDWFIKRSTVTGQETFFPKKLICDRMKIIKDQKDNVSLEELSKQFRDESKIKPFVVISTIYGDKIINLSDIRSAVIDFGNGKTCDITCYLIGGKNEN